MLSLLGFPLILNQMTLSDIEWPFYLKLCFPANMSGDISFMQISLVFPGNGTSNDSGVVKSGNL